MSDALEKMIGDEGVQSAIKCLNGLHVGNVEGKRAIHVIVARIARDTKTISELPATADHVHVAPGMQVWNLSPEGNPMTFRVLSHPWARCKSPVEDVTRAVAKSYSTPEAAVAAGRGK